MRSLAQETTNCIVANPCSTAKISFSRIDLSFSCRVKTREVDPRKQMSFVFGSRNHALKLHASSAASLDKKIGASSGGECIGV